MTPLRQALPATYPAFQWITQKCSTPGWCLNLQKLAFIRNLPWVTRVHQGGIVWHLYDLNQAQFWRKTELGKLPKNDNSDWWIHNLWLRLHHKSPTTTCSISHFIPLWNVRWSSPSLLLFLSFLRLHVTPFWNARQHKLIDWSTRARSTQRHATQNRREPSKAAGGHENLSDLLAWRTAPLVPTKPLTPDFRPQAGNKSATLDPTVRSRLRRRATSCLSATSFHKK